MPSRNAIKVDVPDSYYHIYSRGVNKQSIFIEPMDFVYFEKLLSRYLSLKQHESISGRLYPNFSKNIELLSYCLMNNHFHLLIYQVEDGSMASLMRSLMTSYSKYFNLKYKRRGPVFESRYKAALISNQTYLEHISKYIHLNPRYWRAYKYSSLKYYLNKSNCPDWIKLNKIQDLFSNSFDYLSFLEDYEDQKAKLKSIKDLLADN